MGPGPGDDDSAAEGMRLGGEVTGRVQAGRFVLEVGSPAGIRAHFAPGQATDPSSLRVALSQPESPGGVAGVEEGVEDLERVTSKVERSLELFTALAQGRILDREVLMKEVDVLLGALERADREGRHRDALRLARALAGLLALLMRWVALVESLRLALRAAYALGDAPGIAWARHELGTLFLGADDAAAANGELQESLRMRREIGDEAGAEVTQHNLAALQQAFYGRGGGGPRPVVVAAVVAGVLLLAAVGVGIALTVLGGDDGPPSVDTTAPTVSITDAPEDPTTDRTASFVFEADEEVQRFECSLDDGPFEECLSPENVIGPLDFGPHVFAVRAVDFAGNTGQAARHEWTIERGEGPVAVILDGPDELTRETEARFSIEALGATRIECKLDDKDPEECPALAVFTVDEGEHTLVVRGFADDTPGPPATYLWTVDTTPPEVTIDAVTFTGPLEVEVAFTPNESGLTVECSLLERTLPPEGEPEPEPVLVETQENCEDPAVFTDLDPETYYRARVTVTDAAGNVGEPAEEDFDTVSEVD